MTSSASYSMLNDIIIVSDPKKTPLGYSCVRSYPTKINFLFYNKKSLFYFQLHLCQIITTVGTSSADIGYDGGILKSREYRYIATSKDLTNVKFIFSIKFIHLCYFYNRILLFVFQGKVNQWISDIKFLDKNGPPVPGYVTIEKTSDSSVY